MILKGLFSDTISALERSLDNRSRNHQLISSNIANLDTPNYKAFKMVADEAMDGASKRNLPMAQTHASHLSAHVEGTRNMRAERVESNPDLMRGDGNTVSVDREMSNLAENTLLFNAGIRMTSKQFQLLMDAIRGSK